MTEQHTLLWESGPSAAPLPPLVDLSRVTQEEQPLVWLYEYKDSYRHPFLFAKPLDLPAGTVIRGVPANAEMILMPAKKGSRSQK